MPERLDYIEELYNYSFVFLVFFVILTLKFTRRRRGFKVTPMDFLILFIALVAPYIAGTYTAHKEIGAVAAKTIMLFFSYEVLIGELRGRFDKLTFATICTLIAHNSPGLPWRMSSGNGSFISRRGRRAHREDEARDYCPGEFMRRVNSPGCLPEHRRQGKQRSTGMKRSGA